jgi:quinol monooxygenase YgiN
MNPKNPVCCLRDEAFHEMTTEIFVFARLHARPGKQRDVYDAMFEVQGSTRKEPGCLNYGAFRSVRDPDEFYIHTRWKDRAAFEHHAELDHTVRFVELVEPLLDHPFKVTLSEQLW